MRRGWDIIPLTSASGQLETTGQSDEPRIRKDYAPTAHGGAATHGDQSAQTGTPVKVGIAAKRKLAGWDIDYLLNGLCP
jgi:hypothetical protein